MKQKIISGIIIGLLFASLSFAIYSSFSFVKAQRDGTIPKVFGYHILFVETGSMRPELPIGGIVVVKPVTIDTLEEGDIIAFYTSLMSGGVLVDVIVTHRVYSVNGGEEITITTKGDDNPTPDIWTVKGEDLIGEVVLKITFLTFLMGLLSNTSLVLVIVVIIILIFVVSEGINLIREYTKYQYEKEVAGKKEENSTSDHQ
jgi:signal peptidase